MESDEVVGTYKINPIAAEAGEEDPDEFIHKIDNGSMISTGLWFTKEEFVEFKELCAEWHVNIAKADYDEANHSGCQSSCVRRGDKKCTW